MIFNLPARLVSIDDGLPIFVLRLLLLPLTLLHLVLVSARNALHDAGLLGAVSVPAPVVSVGNLTAGGTGKTPLVIALAERALAAGRRVAIVARGYGAIADAEGRTDEVALIARRCPRAQLVVAPDKLSGARQAAAAGAELILVDDGFQHRRLHRDVDIVVIDARAPFGNGSVLPGGPLREPPGGLGRADLVVMTHGEGLPDGARSAAESAVRAHKLGVPIVWGRHVARGVRPVGGGEPRPAAELAGRDVHLFCGVASPAGFRDTVAALGANVTGLTAFGDHHAFSGADVAAVRAQAGASLLLCTEKDADKVARCGGNDDVACLVIDLEFETPLPPIVGLDAPWSPPAAHDEHAHH